MGTCMIARSLLYYWRTNLGVALAAAVATAALVGALLVGDSVRFTLRQAALSRLGDIHLAMQTDDRYFTRALADRLDESNRDFVTTSALHVQGMAAVPGRDRRANRVNIIGIDPAFTALAVERDSTGQVISSVSPELEDDPFWINRSLAEQLNASVGDTILLRFAKPSALSRDVPLGSESVETVSLRMAVTRILDDEQWPARFDLRAEQVPPMNAFVLHDALHRATGLEGRANLILSAAPPREGRDGREDAMNAFVREMWKLPDVQMEVREVSSANFVGLRTSRVFLDPQVVAAIESGQQSATYFVNELAHDDATTPYSMVTAFDPGESELLPDDMADDEIVITEWLAQDLAVDIGDTVTLRYYVVGDARRLSERQATFTVRNIVPTEPPGGDRHLMPDFPGLTDADSPLEWQPPPDLNIDLGRIRPEDEQYWKEHRGAPKAFVTLDWARRHWATRFGLITSMRWPGDMFTVEQIEARVREKIDPATLGLFFRDVRTPALQAAEQGHDFGQLFIGLSFFVIFAAMVLTALMFAFGVERRTPQVGALLALGFTPRKVRLWLMTEGMFLAMIGALLGLPLGIAYTKGILWGLSNLWQEAVGQITLRYHAEPLSLVIGAIAGVLVAALSMAWVLRRQARQPVRALLAARFGIEPSQLRAERSRTRGLALASGCIGGAVAFIVLTEPDQAAAAFFAAGSLLLLGGLTAAWVMLVPMARRHSVTPSLPSIGWRNATRRRGRSLATITMLACGTFLLIAINAFRHDPSHAPESATLGLDLFGQTTLPISYDLNTPEGREALGLDGDLEDVHFVQGRLLEGDEASCLNLNRPQAPPLLGMDLKLLQRPTLSAQRSTANAETVSALVDESVAKWVLHVKVGDEIEYLDERGQPFKIRIASLLPRSILQGYLVISEDDFKRRFPSRSGYQVFLVDAPPPPGRAQAIRGVLERALSDYGMTVTTTAERLAMFNAVENTYLSIFSVLGGLGVLLGCAGLALVLLRNVLERRSELALMRAVGFGDDALRKLLLAEHWGLIAMGLLCGVVSALVAVIPSLRQRDAGLPYATITLILAVIALAALLWTLVAAALALRGHLVQALRSE